MTHREFGCCKATQEGSTVRLRAANIFFAFQALVLSDSSPYLDKVRYRYFSVRASSSGYRFPTRSKALAFSRVHRRDTLNTAVEPRGCTVPRNASASRQTVAAPDVLQDCLQRRAASRPNVRFSPFPYPCVKKRRRNFGVAFLTHSCALNPRPVHDPLPVR